MTLGLVGRWRNTTGLHCEKDLASKAIFSPLDSSLLHKVETLSFQLSSQRPELSLLFRGALT